MSTGRARMPLPQGEMTPQELADLIRDWAEEQGYDFELTPASGEFGRVVIRDPNGGYTTTTVPNAHQGRRLRKDKARYPVKQINKSWRT